MRGVTATQADLLEQFAQLRRQTAKIWLLPRLSRATTSLTQGALCRISAAPLLPLCWLDGLLLLALGLFSTAHATHATHSWHARHAAQSWHATFTHLPHHFLGLGKPLNKVIDVVDLGS